MSFTLWPDLIDELKIEVLRHAVISQPYPQLNHFALTSRESNGLSQDTQVWQSAIRRYFPVLEQELPRQFRANAFALYKNTYLSCKTLLLQLEIPMSCYFKALEGDFGTLNVAQKNLVHVCMAILGHRKFVDMSVVNNEDKERRMTFATKVGAGSYVTMLLSQKKEPVQTTCIRNALLLAAENDHAAIVATILSLARIWLDLTTIRKAAILASNLGQFASLQMVLTHSPGAMDVQTKSQIFKEAMIKGHLDIALSILKHTRLSAPTLREAFMLAIEHNQCKGAELLLEHVPLQITHSARLEGIRLSLKYVHEQMACLLVERHWDLISSSRRVSILSEAISQGMMVLTTSMLTIEGFKLSKTTKYDLMKVAASHNQVEILKYLLCAYGDELSLREKKMLIQTSCFQATLIDDAVFLGQKRDTPVEDIAEMIERLDLAKSQDIQGQAFTPFYNCSRTDSPSLQQGTISPPSMKLQQ